MRIIEEEYLQKGSVGLRDFVERRIKTASSLVEAMDKHPRFYRSIRESTFQVRRMIPEIRRLFFCLKEVYPDAVFPDVYFLIGKMMTGGTVSPNGSLIGTEMYARNEKMPLEELSEWHRRILKPIEEIPFVVLHELIHLQQTYWRRCRTLLENCIKEGVADFLGEVISGKEIDKYTYKYGDAHERDLWEEFHNEMKGEDQSKWLYQGEEIEGRPEDLGYFVGYKICRSYYENMHDKSQAVWDILNIQDFDRFLHVSRYGEKF